MKHLNQSIVRLLSLSVLLFFFFFNSCQQSSTKSSEKLLEQAIEKETGEDATVKLNKDGAVFETNGHRVEIDAEAKKWPDEIPADVPEFKSGRIDGIGLNISNDGTRAWSIMYKDLPEDYLDQYNKLLRQKGFETNFMNFGPSQGAISTENEKYSIMLMSMEEGAVLTVALLNP
ncbi:MAG: hypothetical protein IH597_12570 [Bacteroidales bacterium]|nr:hypothetical protein [Bacteroidales bacterium]